MGYGMDPNAPPLPPSLTNQVHAQTAPAFQLLESLVGAFSSLAQLFESTYMATHSSFFAMVGVADQLGGIKTYLGQVLGVFSLLRLGRRVVAWLRGERGGGDAAGGAGGGLSWADEWRIGAASGLPSQLPGGGGHSGAPDKRPSSKPLLVFLAAAVGLPYLMTKLVRLLTRLQEEQQQQQMRQQHGQQQGQLTAAAGSAFNMAPGQSSSSSALVTTTNGTGGGAASLTFARTLHPFETSEPHELALKRDEIVAVLQRFEGGREMGWWRGRTRDGRIGWFPGNYVSFPFGSAIGNRDRRRGFARTLTTTLSCRAGRDPTQTRRSTTASIATGFGE